MIYKELIFSIKPSEDYHKDLLINGLSEIGFDTFEEIVQGFKAYIPSDDFDQTLLDETIKLFEGSFVFSYEINTIPATNWNEVWESNFRPLIIKDQCHVRATFHDSRPEFPYEIIIDPKMAFGTGHHQTTAMMMEYMLEIDFSGTTVLDMGCGTGILGILASKLGANEVFCIDYDAICFDSSIENTLLNHSENIKSLCGSKEVIPDLSFEIILANINRNILLDQIARYAEVLTPGGKLFLSGFYKDPDLTMLIDVAKANRLNFKGHKIQESWVAAYFVKDFL
jgi:ribosomal protein L11 methyltransferase